MVNYIESITLNNQRIDTQYDFVNDWSSLELTAKAGLVSDETKNVVVFKEPLFFFSLSDEASGLNKAYYPSFHYYQDEDTYAFSKVGGLPTHRELSVTITQNNTSTSITERIDGQYASGFTQPTREQYKVYNGGPERGYAYYQPFDDGRIYIGTPGITRRGNIFKFYYLTIKKDGQTVLDARACLDENGIECLYDSVKQIYLYKNTQAPSDSMIRTVVLNGEWQELPVNDGIDVSKLRDRMDTRDKVVDGYAALFDSICITAGQYNGCPVLVSDYTEQMQENTDSRKDYLELLPKGRIELPWNRDLMALNRPMVKGNAGDIVRVAVR